MADICFSEQLRQFAAESTRIRADSGGVRQCPADVPRTSGGVARRCQACRAQRGPLGVLPKTTAEFAGNFFWRKAGGSARSPHGSARKRAFPRRKVFRRPNSLIKILPHCTTLSVPFTEKGIINFNSKNCKK